MTHQPLSSAALRLSLLAAAAFGSSCQVERPVVDGSSRIIEYGIPVGYTLERATTAAPFPKRSDRDVWLDKSSFVFVGKVVEVEEAKRLPDRNDPCCVITVELSQFLLKPAGFSIKPPSLLILSYDSSEQRKRFKEGEFACFYANEIPSNPGRIWAELQGSEIVATPTSNADLAQITNRFVATVEDHRARRWGAALRQADAVIVAKVISNESIDPATFISSSEHTAYWQQSILEVTNNLHGDAARHVIVRYPRSRDVAWNNWPRLKQNFDINQTSIFALRRGNPPTCTAPLSIQTQFGVLDAYYPDVDGSGYFHVPVYQASDHQRIKELLEHK